MTLYIVDIDGTVADARARYAVAGPEPKVSKKSRRYSDWVRKIMNKSLMKKDPVVPGIVDLVASLNRTGYVVFVTSREHCHKDVTEAWLEKHGLLRLSYGICMRPIGNLQPDAELKEELILKLRNVFDANFVVVLDDDLSGGLAKVCTKQGWLMLKAQGYSL